MDIESSSDTPASPLLIAAGKKFKLGSVDSLGRAQVPTSRSYAADARGLGLKVTRNRWRGTTWLCVDGSLAESAIAAYEAHRAA